MFNPSKTNITLVETSLLICILSESTLFQYERNIDMNLVDTGPKLNVHKALRRRLGGLLNVLNSIYVLYPGGVG